MLSYYDIPTRLNGYRYGSDAYANDWADTPLPSPDDVGWLHRRVRDDGMTFNAVAERLDTRSETVSKNLRAADLHPDTESFGERPWQNREWLWRQFRRDQRSTTAVANEMGISKRLLRHCCANNDIQRPDARMTQQARAAIQASGNNEVSDAAKALDPTIKTDRTPIKQADVDTSLHGGTGPR